MISAEGELTCIVKVTPEHIRGQVRDEKGVNEKGVNEKGVHEAKLVAHLQFATLAAGILD